MEGENGTTRQGVSEGAEQRQRPVSQRELALAAIEEKLDQQEEQQTAAPAAAAPATTDEKVLVEDPERFRVRVKVGGKDEERSVGQVVAELQTANGRLRQFATREKELEARERDLQERERQIELARLPSSEEDDAAVDQKIDEAIDAMVDGDRTTAREALKGVLGKGRQEATPPVDETAIISRVKTELSQERQAEEQAAAGSKVWDEFLRDNPEFRDETDDQGQPKPHSPLRVQGDYIFERDYAARVQSGELSYREALDKTAEDARQVLSVPATKEEKSGKEKRAERKSQIDNLPVAAGARQVVAEEDAEESHGSIIASMRKARGLPA